MTWTKLGDEYADQSWKLSDAAFRLHTEALIWSNRKHLDGRLDKGEMRHWAKRPESAVELVSLGWWEDNDDHFLIVYHLGWQRTAAEWLHQSEVNKANQARRKAKRGRNSGKANNETNNESFNESFNETNNETNNERVWSGQDRKDAFKGGENSTNGNGSGPHCRYCNAELPAHMAAQRTRGYCSRTSCYAEARAEMS